jgi:hypothetical protein
MKKVKNFFASILVIGSILMYNSCRVDDDVISPDPIINVRSDTTIILPTSSVMLSGSVDNSNGHTYNFDHYVWKVEEAPLNTPDLKIENPSSPQTNVTGLTRPGEYEFSLMCVFTGSRGAGRYYFGNSVKVTVLQGAVVLSNFWIGAWIYTVQSIERRENHIEVSSFRNATDSGSISFFFLNDTAIPAFGSAADFKVVPVVRNADEVRVSAVRTVGTNGTEWDCIGDEEVKANVSVNTSGKISIVMPPARAKLLLETVWLDLAADIHEP